MVSLIVNFTLFSKLGHVEYQLNSVINTQHGIMSDVNDQTSHIQNVLNDIKEQQSWISPIRMDVNSTDIKGGQAEATFEWQVKELQKDSEVVFHYAVGGSENFTSIPVEKAQQGMFRVKVPFDVKVEPKWDVGIVDNSQQEKSKKVLEEGYRQSTLKYYVSVSYSDMMKNSEIQSENIGYLGSRYYGDLHAHVWIEEETFNIEILNHGVQSSHVVEEAYLLKYEDKTLLGKEEIEFDESYDPEDPKMRRFRLDGVKRYEDMRIVVQVVYSNGETFEKEVYK